MKRTKSISGASIFKQSLTAKLTGSRSAPSFLNIVASSAKGSDPFESMQEYQHVDAGDSASDELVIKDHTFGFLVLEDKKGKEKERETDGSSASSTISTLLPQQQQLDQGPLLGESLKTSGSPALAG